MTSTELPFNGLTGYIMLTTLVIALGYQVAMQILNSTSDSRVSEVIRSLTLSSIIEIRTYTPLSIKNNNCDGTPHTSGKQRVFCRDRGSPSHIHIPKY